jgi:hypothetical protein
MRSIRPSLFVVACSLSGLSALSAAAQSSPDLPQPSPKARVEQRVGLTDVTVDYSSPAVKGRKIWGELVAYDHSWRTGANAATKLTVTSNFTFGGKPVPAGSYALYTIPGKSAWTVALNSSTDAWGDAGYDAKKDLVRVQLTPAASPARERLTFVFSNTTDSATQLDLEWEKLRVSIPLTVDTKAAVLANISDAVESGWRPYWASARWLLENGGDLDKAMTYIDQSIAIKANWMNNWVRAQILEKKGKAQEAVATAEKTVQLGTGDRTFESFYKADVTKSLSGWKKKL